MAQDKTEITTEISTVCLQTTPLFQNALSPLSDSKALQPAQCDTSDTHFFLTHTTFCHISGLDMSIQILVLLSL